VLFINFEKVSYQQQQQQQQQQRGNGVDVRYKYTMAALSEVICIIMIIAQSTTSL